MHKTMQMNDSSSITIVYHFFYPDDVISAQHKADLAIGLAKRNWDVTVLTSNRFCREPNVEIEALEEEWNGIKIIRVPRPARPQSSNTGRLLNSWAIQRGWLKRLKCMSQPDVLMLGTDPQFSQAMLPQLKNTMPSTLLSLWCFDLYPDILTVADSMLQRMAGRVLSPFAKRWSRDIDLMIDIGPCMRKKLAKYGRSAKQSTLIPWALSEPLTMTQPDPKIRQELFGDAKVGLLYSGTFGQAHEHNNFLELARKLRGSSVAFCFAGRGNRMDHLKSLVTDEDDNIRFAGFCPIEELPLRLEAADMHLISLKQDWDGLVVPSKFFGALAAGKPVIYDGGQTSDIGIWLDQFKLGFNLSADSLSSVASWLSNEGQNTEALRQLQQNAFDVYQQRFHKEKVLDTFDSELRNHLAQKKR